MRRLVVTLGALAACSLGAGCAWLIGVSGDTEIAATIAASDDAEAGVDAAPDARVPDADAGARDADAGPLPGEIACGASPCPVPASQCCSDVDASTCDPAGSACTGLVRTCDEAADCDPGEVCCVTQIAPKRFATACKASCDVGEPQACASSAECGDAGACLPWRCGAVDVKTCGASGSDGGC